MDNRGRALLDFERLQWRHRGNKLNALREQFGLSETAYYQHLLAMTTDPEAWVHAPDLIKRLRRRTGR